MPLPLVVRGHPCSAAARHAERQGFLTKYISGLPTVTAGVARAGVGGGRRAAAHGSRRSDSISGGTKFNRADADCRSTMLIAVRRRPAASGLPCPSALAAVTGGRHPCQAAVPLNGFTAVAAGAVAAAAGSG